MLNQNEISTLTGIVIILATAIVIFGGVFSFQYFAVQEVDRLKVIQPPVPTSSWKTYKNTEYGFEIKFSDSWKGYSVEKQNWQGWLVDTGEQKYSGVEIVIKNPQTTSRQAFQDIPIMVFTHDVWNLVSSEAVSVSAAPVGPEKIGGNLKYVFATPPRWYGFTDAQGWQEAVDIVKTFKAF